MVNEKLDDILLRLRAGDRAALQHLFHQQYPMVCGVIRRFITDHSTVEDLAQEVFVKWFDVLFGQLAARLPSPHGDQ